MISQMHRNATLISFVGHNDRLPAMSKTLRTLLIFVLLPPANSIGQERESSEFDALGDRRPHGAVARFETPRFGHGSEVSSLDFSHDGRLLASAGPRLDGKGEARLWEVKTGMQIKRFEAPRVHDVRFSPDGKTLALAGKDLVLWDLAADRQRLKIMGRYGHVRFSPDGKWMAAATLTSFWRQPHKLRLFDAATGKQRFELGRGTTPCFTPDGKRIVFGRGRRIEVVDVPTGESVRSIELPNPDDGPYPVQLSSDGRTAMTGRVVSEGEPQRSFKLVHFWDIKTGKQIRTVKLPDLVLLTLSPDGKTMLASGLTYPLLDATTGKVIRVFKHPQQGCVAGMVAFSHDGKTLAVGSRSGVIQLWKTDTGARLHANRDCRAGEER